MKKIFLLVTTSFVILTSCSVSKKGPSFTSPLKLAYLDQYEIPNSQVFESTATGGLSGIDYDPVLKQYYLVCDDRSDLNPARFYTAKINIVSQKIDSVSFSNVTSLRDPSGKNYPSAKANLSPTVDPEALRYNAKQEKFVWSTEGERIVGPGQTRLTDPAIYIMDRAGMVIDSFRIPLSHKMFSEQDGPRQNGVFEGLAFSGDFSRLYVSTEEPLYQDGPHAGTGDSSAVERILEYSTDSKKLEAQYAYRIDPVATIPDPEGGFKVNGISDIMWIDTDKLLVIERSFSVGKNSSTIKVFIADLAKATDIQQIKSMEKPGRNIRFVKKQLILNMDSLGFYVDNIEGVTFGPTLENKKRSMIFVSDNNFNPLQKTQVLLFEAEGF